MRGLQLFGFYTVWSGIDNNFVIFTFDFDMAMGQYFICPYHDRNCANPNCGNSSDGNKRMTLYPKVSNSKTYANLAHGNNLALAKLLGSIHGGKNLL